MDRLTNRKEADADRVKYQKQLEQGYARNIAVERFLKLAEFEDAEEQGRLHIAPCADGTEIWRVLDVDSEMMQLFEIEEPISCETYIHGYTEMAIGEINKDWFLTEEAAKSALKTKSTGGDN